MEVVGRFSKRRKRRRRGTQSSEADWSSIPGDVLCLVAEKIDSVEDYVSFSAVCRDWYSVAADCKEKPNFVAPYCMLYDPNISNSKKFRFCTFDPNLCPKEIVLDLPEFAGRKFWGSPFGWMVTFCPRDSQFSLFNPFYQATIPLPSLRSLIGSSTGIIGVEHNPYKAFLTANPDDSLDSCIVLVVVHVGEEDSILAFSRPGDSVWSRIQGPSDLNDIIYFKGNLYGVRRNQDHTPLLVLIQLDQPYPRAVELPMAKDCGKLNFSGFNLSGCPDDVNFTRRYLVDLNGELCLVIRYVAEVGKTFFFKIFEINLSTRKWTQVRSLGDQCLLVGSNYTFTCKATSWPVNPLILEYPPHNFLYNYIFYTHDDDYTFYLQNQILKRHDEGVLLIMRVDACFFIKKHETAYPQLWIMPSLRFRRLEQVDAPQEDAMVLTSE